MAAPTDPAGTALREAHAAWQRGDAAAAESHCRRALALGADDARVHLLLGISLRERDPVSAESSLRRAMERDPGLADAPFQLGNLHRRQQRYAAAIAAYERALALAPRHAGIRNNLGLALDGAGETERAAAAWRAVLSLDPAHRQAAGNLVHALVRDGSYREGAAVFERHLSNADVDATLRVDYGICQHELGRHDGAVASFRQALAAAPDDALVLTNLGSVLADIREHEAAETILARAVAIDPERLYPTCLRANCRQHLCRWEGLDAMHARIRELTARPDRDDDYANPFTVLSMPVSPSEQLGIARRWARTFLPRSRGAAQPPRRTRGPGDRLRLGYLSSDFRTHAMAFLLTEVWERHDRRRLATHAYSIGPRESSPLRSRIEAAFEHFRDCADETAAETARRIADDGIDVLIDLNGYTTHARTAIPALRPARVQASWLGYLGTTGAEFMDYVITDGIALPAEAEPFFSERPLRLPHCYCPSDTRRESQAQPPSHEEAGLARDVLVFCCFNDPYKILPPVFDAWMRILARVPGSVLWLALGNEAARANLRREAAARGVDAARLVFAAHVAPALHLARHRLAHLYLDTLPYNAGTTANDALLMGLPILTCAGETMAGRVASSQLHAIGLPELVARDLREYEAKAVALASDPAARRALQAKLEGNRATMPLFDMAAFTRDLEAALEGIAA